MNGSTLQLRAARGGRDPNRTPCGECLPFQPQPIDPGRIVTARLVVDQVEESHFRRRQTSPEKERRYRGARLVARLPQACPVSVPGRHPRRGRILRRSTSAGAPLSGHCHLCTSGSPVAPPRRPCRPVV